MAILTDHLPKGEQADFDWQDAEGAAAPFAGIRISGGRYAPLFLLGVFYLVTSMLLRLVLFGAYGPPALVPLWELPPIVGVGMVNDCIEVLYLLALFSLFLLLIPQRLYNSRPGRWCMALFLWLTLFGMFYLTAVQFFFFQEFDARFNLVAVDYLIYPHEVFVNIWQSYPVARVLVFMAALSSLVMFLLWPAVRQSMAKMTPIRQRFKITGLHVGLLCAAIIGPATHSLDFSENRITNELTANGLSSFFQAFHTNGLDYNQYYTVNDPRQNVLLLKDQLGGGGSFERTGPGWLNRSFAADPGGLGKLNVVVIVEESLGCEHVGSCGKGQDIKTALANNPTGLTPSLDRLASQGLFFNRAYATGTRTVRGLEAITASFPPIPGESIVKRPGNDDIATWGRVMRANGYRTSFLYGGFGQFDNMNSFFGANGFAISDRLSIEDPVFTNIWGVSDQDLFRHAEHYFDREADCGTPFFSVIMTTSNHSPFTFPAGIKGIPPEGGGRFAGVLYADYALGEFFRTARNHSWYRNTLFVVVADHGARVYGKEQIPLPSYEIPLLIMAPGHLTPRQVNTPISQMDIAPTVLGLLGLPYEAPFFGRNVLAKHKTPGGLLFNHNHDVALYRDNKLVVLGLRREVDTYTYRLGSSEFQKTEDDPALISLATAYYQTGFNLFREHNYQ